jgi:hypothetical protein
VSECTIYSRSAAALWRRVGDEVLITDSGSPEVQRLSLPASIAWLLLEEPRTQGELTETLAAEYSAPADEVAEHVAHLLSILGERGWVTRRVEHV